MINNIAIDHPVALLVLEHCKVSMRSHMGSGSVTHFNPITTPLLSDIQSLKSPDVFKLSEGLELSADLQLDKGIPTALEIKCLNWNGWDEATESLRNPHTSPETV